MAQAATKEKASSNATSRKAFVLGEEQLALLAPRGGREAKPSAYLEEVKAAIKSGDAMGIPTSATVKSTWIMGQLRKAMKELDVKLKIWNREDSLPRGFVGFQVIKPESE